MPDPTKALEQQYQDFCANIQSMQEKLRHEMSLAFNPDEQLPSYRQDIIKDNIGSNRKPRLFRSPKNLLAWTLREAKNKKNLHNIDENSFKSIMSRIEKFAMLQGSLPFQPKDWLDVFTNDLAANTELHTKLEHLLERLQSGEWLNFNHSNDSNIMRDPDLAIYGLMLFTLDKISLEQYIDLCRVVQLVREYPPIYETVPILTKDGNLSDEFEKYLQSSGEGFFGHTAEEKDRIKELLQTVPAEQRQLIKIFCPDYTERALENVIDDNAGKQNREAYYHFISIALHNRIQFARLNDQYKPIFPIQGTLPGYGFIKLQLHGLKPASLLYTTAEEVLWIHGTTSSATAITDHDLFIHSTVLSFYDEKDINAIFGITKWLEKNNYFTQANMPSGINELNDFSAQDQNMLLRQVRDNISSTAICLLFLGKDYDRPASNLMTSIVASSEYQKAEDIYGLISAAGLIDTGNSQSLMKKAIILNFYVQLSRLLAKGISANFPQSPKNLRELIDSNAFKNQLAALRFSFNPDNLTYEVSYFDEKSNTTRSIISSNYENPNPVLEECDLYNLLTSIGFIKDEVTTNIKSLLECIRSNEVYEIHNKLKELMNPPIRIEDYYFLSLHLKEPEIVHQLVYFYPGNDQVKRKTTIEILYKLNPECIKTEAENRLAYLKQVDKLNDTQIINELVTLLVIDSLSGEEYVAKLLESNQKLKPILFPHLMELNVNPEFNRPTLKIKLNETELDACISSTDSDNTTMAMMVVDALSRGVRPSPQVVMRLLTYWLIGIPPSDNKEFHIMLDQYIKDILSQNMACDFSDESPENILSTLFHVLAEKSIGADINQLTSADWQNKEVLPKVLSYLMKKFPDKPRFFSALLDSANDVMTCKNKSLLLARQLILFLNSSPDFQKMKSQPEFAEKINKLSENFDMLLRSKSFNAQESAVTQYKQWAGVHGLVEVKLEHAAPSEP